MERELTGTSVLEVAAQANELAAIGYRQITEILLVVVAGRAQYKTVVRKG
jgi:hypothetical protein